MPTETAPHNKKTRRQQIMQRKWVSWLWNRQTFIFLFFLALSTTFWLFQAMNETYEQDFAVPIEVRNVPGNVVITTDLPNELHVSLRDKGSVLFTYRYTRKFKPVIIDFDANSNGTGHITIQGSELLRQIAGQLLGSTQVVNYKPDTIEFFYNYGLCKRVPVVVQSNVRTSRQFSLANILLARDSVMVYASKELLDTITAAYTHPIALRNLSDTARVSADIQKVRGAKFVPSSVGLTFCVDRLVEKTVQVPVQQVNFPATKQLRTFPATVNVTFQVAMGLYRNITSNNFVLVVNYEDLLRNKSNVCHLSLKTIPMGVTHVRINPQDVEYVIEEIGDDESDNDNE